MITKIIFHWHCASLLNLLKRHNAISGTLVLKGVQYHAWNAQADWQIDWQYVKAFGLRVRVNKFKYVPVKFSS